MEQFSESYPKKTDEISRISRYALICAALWTLLLSSLFVAYAVDNRHVVHEIAHNMAQASFEKDLLFRRWAARHGGVYAPITADTPVNPYLENLPERDITTPSGKLLTLINPAYMSRQIFELAREIPGITQGHITSLNPIRLENAPDAWETQALKKLEQGAKEVVEHLQINGQPHLRFMRPLVTEKPCLRCHAAQGHKEGDGLGGISATISIVPIQKAMNREMLQEAFIHSFIWLLGLGFIWFGTKRITRITKSLRNERNKLLESEESNRRQKENYRAIVEAFDGQIYICSHDYKILFMNEKLIERTGRNAVGELCFKALHNLEAICPWCVNERVYKGETVRWEVLSPKDDHWYYVVNTPIHNDDGTISKQAMIQDITERKRSDEALQRSEEQSRNNALLLQSVIEHFPGVVFWKDTKSVYLGCNKAFSDAAGLNNPEEIVGKSDFDLPWAETEAVHYRDDDQNVIESGVAKLHIIETQHQANNQLAWFDTCKVPLRDRLNTIYGVLGASFEITAIKHAEEERLQLQQQFHHAQKLESLGVLAGGIAHDFNNILTVILGHCFIARENLYSDQEYKELFQQIETAGHRAADLCRQMLTYSGKSSIEQTRVNLWLLIDEVIKMLKAAIRKNVTIELDLEHDTPDIRGDSGQIQQIVMNLIINAAEAIGDANGTIRVVLKKIVYESDQTETDTFGTFIKAGEYACLQVTDTGIGMNEETQNRIFEPFYTTKFTGRGLGMSAIRGIVASHEALLHLNSTPGVGTSFTVCFPVTDTSAYTETTSTAPVSLEKVAGTILLVDDEQTLRDMGVDLLDTLGFISLTAANGHEALEIYRERGSEIDLILLDLIMPVMGGIDAYHELRKINPSVPVIICSGYSEESVEYVIKNDQHAGFVHKPYKPSELRDKMIRMMAERQE